MLRRHMPSVSRRKRGRWSHDRADRESGMPIRSEVRSPWVTSEIVPHEEPAAADVIADRYELKEEIGRGGMATVHRAWDRRLGRDVAIKLLAPALAADPLVRRRFEAEANVAACVSHPNVVTIFDTNERDG